MPLGIITNTAGGVDTNMPLDSTRLFYKGGTSVFFIDGTSADCNSGMPVVCAVSFMYLFYLYMYHTHLKNIPKVMKLKSEYNLKL